MTLTLAIATAPKRDSKTWKNDVVTWEDFKRWCANPGNKKEAGNYVFGRLIGTRRSKRTIEARSALTLDVDFPQPGFLTDVMLFPFNLVWHTTYSSTPESPRYRIIIPLDREVSPDEYVACVTVVMDMLGTEQFDLGSTQPERYMFRPAAQRQDFYSWGEVEGPIATADDLIMKVDDVVTEFTPPQPSRRKRDPFQIEGVVGAFNRVFENLQDLIDAYDLPYEYAGQDRWILKGSLGAPGMGPVPGRAGLWYSFHATDPAFMQTCSAFDLARTHLFGELDEDAKPGTPVNKLPSHARMIEEILNGDPAISDKVMAETWRADFGGPSAGPAPAAPTPARTTASSPPAAPSGGDWRTGLMLNQAGAVRDTLDNWDLILANDPVFQSLAHNEVTLATEPQTDLPWRKVNRANAVWTKDDTGQLALYLERTVRLKVPRERLEAMVHRAALAHVISPVKDYLSSLVWDGVPRVETCLPGVKVTDFTRLAARKSLVAAVARALDPGVKWDHSLILFGGEGLGKSLWIERMSKGWTAELGDLRSKDTLQIVARTWIAVADEGHSLKKADSGTMKAFMTRRTDVYRTPYETFPSEHPRRCVVWGSTNEQTFLRREAGNRRFLIVRCGPYDIDAVTPEYVDQVWAEAVHLYRQGERLWLTREESDLALEEREIFTEENPLAGQIGAYLDMPVPPNWYQMSTAARFTYRQNYLELGLDESAETMQQDKVCALQVWYEVLNGNRKPQQVEVREINEAIRLLPDWYPVPKARRFDQNYGVQKGFNRFQDEELI